MSPIRIPPQLADAVDEDDYPARVEWLAALPERVTEIASGWELELGDPYLPGGQCAWAAPGRHLKCALPEPDQDLVVAGLLRRLWARPPRDGHPFSSLEDMCSGWADSFELDYAVDSRGLDPGLAREGVAMLRRLPATATAAVLLCTDLHAGNILAARREPWLVIDPKPFVGDPAYDPVQHMLGCDHRLAMDPRGLARRMADLLDLDPERVRNWLFARCAQESLHDPAMRETARCIAP